MSGIARIMLARGYTVSGSDAKRVAPSWRRCGRSARRCTSATARSNLGGADTVVVSTAIRPSNPELAEAQAPRAAGAAPGGGAGRGDGRAARRRGRRDRTARRPRPRCSPSPLQHCGADPSFAIGGNLNESGVNAHNGSGDLFVAEADESDGSFLLLSPAAGRGHQRRGRPPRPATAPPRPRRGRVRRVPRPHRPGRLPGHRRHDDPGAPRLAEAPARLPPTVAHLRHGRRRRPAADRASPSGRHGTSLRRRARRRRARRRSASASPGHHMALQLRGRAARRAASSGCRAAALLAGLARLHRRAPPVRAQGRRPGGVRVYDDYAHHPTEIAPSCARPARSPAAAGSSWPSSRTSTAAPRRSPRSSARRSGWPTRSW